MGLVEVQWWIARIGLHGWGVCSRFGWTVQLWTHEVFIVLRRVSHFTATLWSAYGCSLDLVWKRCLFFKPSVYHCANVVRFYSVVAWVRNKYFIVFYPPALCMSDRWGCVYSYLYVCVVMDSLSYCLVLRLWGSADMDSYHLLLVLWLLRFVCWKEKLWLWLHLKDAAGSSATIEATFWVSFSWCRGWLPVCFS